MIGRFAALSDFSRRLQKVMLLSCVWGVCAGSVAAEPMVIGVPPFDPNQKILDDPSPAATFVRKAVGLGLFADSAGERPVGFELGLADYSSVSADYRRWTFRLRPSAKFSDGSMIEPSDVVFSLERCRDGGRLSALTTVSSRTNRGRDGAQRWIELEARIGGPVAAQDFISKIKECPVVNKQSALIFSSELGVGGNIIAAGAYRIVSYTRGRKYLLERGEFVPGTVQGATAIEVRAFEDPSHALAALRIGSIAGFYTTAGDAVARSRRDETLAVQECKDGFVVRRAGTELPCLERLVVSKVGTHG